MFFRGTSDFFAFYFLQYILLSLFHCVRACDGYTYKQYGTEYEHLQGNILVPDSPQLSHRSLQAFSTDKYRSWCALYCGQRTIIKAQLGEYISLLTEVYDSKCHTHRERERERERCHQICYNQQTVGVSVWGKQEKMLTSGSRKIFNRRRLFVMFFFPFTLPPSPKLDALTSVPATQISPGCLWYHSVWFRFYWWVHKRNYQMREWEDFPYKTFQVWLTQKSFRDESAAKKTP